MCLLVATIIFWNISSKVLKIYHQVFCNSENLLSSINSAHRKFHSDIQNRMAGNKWYCPSTWKRLHKREQYISFLFIHFFNYYFPYNYNYFYYYYYYYYYYYWFIYLSQVKLPVSPGSCFMFVSVKLHHFHF